MKPVRISKIGINLFLINVFIYLTISLYTPYLTTYYAKAGLNAVEIGVLVTIGPLAAIFIQPLWAFLSDRSGRRKDILSLVVLGCGLSIFSYYIGKSFVTFFIAAFLLSIFSTSVVPLSDAIVLRKARKYQFDFSKIRMGGTIGYAIMVIFSGMIVKRHPSWQFAMGFVGYMLLLLVVRILPKDEKEESLSAPEIRITKPTWRERFNILNIFDTKQIFFLLAFACISQIGLSFHYSFLSVYMVQLGYSEGTIGIINSVAAFSELPVLFLINHFLKRNSTLKVTILSCFLVGLRIITVTGENIVFLVLSQMIHGITFMAIYYSCAVFISNHVRQEKQSQGQSILAIIQTGIGSIIGNIAGGYLVDAVGLKAAYRFFAAVVVLACFIITMILFIFQKKEKLKKSTPEIL